MLPPAPLAYGGKIYFCIIWYKFVSFWDGEGLDDGCYIVVRAGCLWRGNFIPLTFPNIVARFGMDGAGLVRRHWIIVGKGFGSWQGGMSLNAVSRINPLTVNLRLAPQNRPDFPSQTA